MSDPRRGLPSASAMQRLAECPGSLALVNKMRELGRVYALPDPARDAGIRIHDWLQKHESGEAENGLVAAELGTARACLKLRDQQSSQWRQLASPNDLETVVERRLWFRQGLIARFSGQPDYVLIDHEAGRAFVANYKTGRREAEEASDNLQLRAEVVLVKHNWPHLVEIAGVIIEPNITWSPEMVIYKADDFVKAEAHILEIVKRGKWQKDRRIPGPWCTYCPAAANCTEAIQYVDRLPGIPDEALVKLPRGKEGVDFWERIKVAKKLVERLEQIYTEILKTEPDALPGYILPAQGKARRFVSDPRKLKDALSEHLTGDEIDSGAEYYPGRIEELLGSKLGIAGKELRKLFEQLTKGTIEVKYDQPFIRPMTKKERDD